MTFDQMCRDIEAVGVALYDLAFYQEGQILQHRFQPSSNCSNCYSVSKAFMVTAVGLLHDDGLIDVKQPLFHYMKDLMPADIDPAWRIMTVEDVLTHQLGFAEGFLDIDTEDASEFPSDYLDIVFHHPLAYLPGTHRQYSDAAYYLISRLVSHLAGERTNDFLNRRLFQPLKVREVAWSCCPQNYPIGATGLYLAAHDMVKLPALYLEGGVWNGQRILSQEWINKVIANEYEFTTKSPTGLMGKSGMYGQMTLFSREQNFAVAWHAFSKDKEGIQRLVDYFDAIQ